MFITSRSTKTEKALLKRWLNFERAGIATMTLGLGAIVKSIADQAMLMEDIHTPVNLLAKTDAMHFGVTVGALGMLAYAVGGLIDDKLKERRLEQESNEAFAKMVDNLMQDKRPDIALLLNGMGDKINQRRELLGKDTIPEVDDFFNALNSAKKEEGVSILDNKDISKLFDRAKNAIYSQEMIEEYREQNMKVEKPKYKMSSDLSL